MKDKFFIFFCLVIVLFFVPSISNAMMLAPYSNLKIVVNTQGQDSSFNFNLKDWEYLSKYEEGNDSCKNCAEDDDSCFEDCNDGYVYYYDWNEYKDYNNNSYDNVLLQTQDLSSSTDIEISTWGGDKYFLTEGKVSDLKVKDISCQSDNSKDKFSYDADNVTITTALSFGGHIVCTFDNVKSKTPVLIVPGITGTELFDGSEKLWPDTTRMITDFSDNFMDPLQFGNNLIPLDNNIKTGDVLKKELTLDYTEKLATEFENQGYVEGESLFTFPYDWRYGVSGEYGDGSTNSDLLKKKILEILAKTGAEKVDVVAHSMGGLIVKKYVQDNPSDSLIDKAVFVGVPETGAVKAVKALVQGDNFGIGFGPVGLNDAEMKKISENMPAAYDLLPSQQYYNEAGSFVSKIDIGNGLGVGEATETDLNYQDFGNYLIDKNLNSQAFLNAENLHTSDFDNFDLRTAGIDLYSVDGCKTGTMANFLEVKYKDILGNEHTDYDNIYLKTGDGTVPIQSSTNLPIDQDKKYYALSSEHSKLLSSDGSRQEIVNLISGSSLSVDSKLVTQDINQCQLNGKVIEVFSPVDIVITDQLGNKMGLVDGNIINEIPNASFEILGEHKFIYLPQGDGQTYTISLQGTGDGTFTIKSQDIANGQITKASVFSNLPVTTDLVGKINIDPLDNSVTISLDNSSTVILPSSVIDASATNDLLPPVSTATLSGNVNVDIKATDKSSGVLDVEYNLDDTGYQKISGDTASFVVSVEGKHTLTFFSTDKAGNNEPEKKIEFEVDALKTTAITGGGGGTYSQVLNKPNQVVANNNQITLPAIQPINKTLKIILKQVAKQSDKNITEDKILVTKEEPKIIKTNKPSMWTAGISFYDKFWDYLKNWIVKIINKFF